MTPSLTFKDFTESDRFLKIQNTFALDHVHSNPTESPYKEVLKQDFEITRENYNPLNNEQFYEDVSFYRDFLFPEIDNLPKKFISFFKNKLEKDLVIKPDDIKDVAQFYLSAFQNQQKLIKDAEHLEYVVKKRLDEKVIIVLDYLSEVYVDPMYSEADKIKFKLKRNEIILLFYLLREGKYIDNKYNSELGALMNRYFLYWDEREESFKQIKKARTTIGDFSNGTKTYTRALENLQSIFTKVLK
ncbi:hypothetical protein DZC72_04250 [Maribacter algicola]|uniref:Uncharacterized protein n=1 Tax=Maribacter algicola TaxID=2498892 RepID=A0A3R8Q545_9FLAO|nr:hypothetical protein [Maribacter algicola]RRQ49809.1 hypothetical protein DZC72_04250 [Maribacter algicola]